MGWAGSLLLIAVGAILRFAVTVNTHGIDLQTVGVILMVVGAVGFVVALFWMAMWTQRGGVSEPPPDGRATSSDPRY
ncbi:MAG TPA: DUF6458 family protein [Solirubrobacteraceae bacterium]|nr:DUF6458 family protein [Solirubrobacteraceae bacterium]